MKICPKFAGIQSSPGACFDYSLNLCEGACAGEESVSQHNEKIQAFIDHCKAEKSDYLLIGDGRSINESAFVLVEEGFYKGFGFLHSEDSIEHWEEFNNFLIQYPDHPEIYKILSSEHATKNYKKIKKEIFFEEERVGLKYSGLKRFTLCVRRLEPSDTKQGVCDSRSDGFCNIFFNIANFSYCNKL